MDNKIKIEQSVFDEPIKVRLRGSAAVLGLMLLTVIAMNTCVSNTLTEQNTEINKQRLDVARKQYTLDSLRFEQIKIQQMNNRQSGK